MKQRERILIGILLSLIALWWVMTDQSPQIGKTIMTPPVPVASAAASEDPFRIRLDLLEKAPQSASPKNIFAPLQSLAPPPPPPPPPLQVIELPPLPDIEEPPPPSPEVLALEAARKVLAEIHLVGYLRKRKDLQTGIFSLAGKIESGGIGDTIFTRIRVKGLTATTANLEETITHAEISLQLSEQR